MDIAQPLRVFTSASHVDVAVALARAAHPLTGREVARAAQRSQQRAQDVLNDLSDQGLVLRTGSEQQPRYALNQEHVATPIVLSMRDLRLASVERLRDAIAEWKQQPLSAMLFGSMARGEGDRDSDIDVLIVRPQRIAPEDPEWQGQLDGLRDGIRSWFGNAPSVFDLAEQDVAGLARREPAFVEELREQSLPLAGRPVRNLLRAIS